MSRGEVVGRVVYFLDLPFSPSSGIGKKVISQVSQWDLMGISVFLIVVVREEFLDEWKVVLNKFSHHLYTQKSFMQRLLARGRAFRAIRHRVENEFDCAYLRLSLMLPSQLWNLRRIRYFLEVNTDVLFEYKYKKPYLSVPYRFMERYLVNRAAGNIFVSHDLEERYTSRYPDIAHHFVSNGVAFPEQASPSLSYKYAAVFLCTEILPWHNIEKFYRLAEVFPELLFLLVGRTNTKSMCRIRVLRNVEHLYTLDSSAEEKILDSSLAGVSFISFGPSGPKGNSPLKVRSYLSRGLPVLADHQDYALSEGRDYFLQVSDSFQSSESELNQIRRFLERWESRRVNQEEVAHISIQSTEKERISILFSERYKV